MRERGFQDCVGCVVPRRSGCHARAWISARHPPTGQYFPGVATRERGFRVPATWAPLLRARSLRASVDFKMAHLPKAVAEVVATRKRGFQVVELDATRHCVRLPRERGVQTDRSAIGHCEVGRHARAWISGLCALGQHSGGWASRASVDFRNRSASAQQAIAVATRERGFQGARDAADLPG